VKHISISFSVFLLAFLVLAGSGGFTIGKMICGGNECAVSSYSLGKAKDCCASENESETSIKSCCCELIDVSYSLDEFSVSEKLNVSAQEFDLFFSSSIFVCHPPFATLRLPLPAPSPPDMQQYLHFIGSLLL